MQHITRQGKKVDQKCINMGRIFIFFIKESFVNKAV